jgi:hypothetical protein
MTTDVGSTESAKSAGAGVDGAGAGRCIVACGALALHITQIAKRRGWDLAVQPLAPELHNRPERIRDAIGDAELVGYADCGTRGALDDLPRLAGPDCYGIFGDFEQHEPGTYYLTDFLVRSFERVVWRGLGLDRHPELRDDYFRHYERVVWLAQRPTEALRVKAEDAALRLGLPLEIRETGDAGLERALEALLVSDTSGVRHSGGNAC